MIVHQSDRAAFQRSTTATMDLDEHWHYGDMAVEIFSTLKLQESKLPAFDLNSKHLNSRRSIVDWIMIVGESILGTKDYLLNVRVVHLAVYLYDCYIEERSVPESSISLAAAASLMIAIKFEGSQRASAPCLLEALHAQTSKEYKISDLREAEFAVLDAINWRLVVPRVCSFVPYFVSTCSDVFVSSKMEKASPMLPNLDETCTSFATASPVNDFLCSQSSAASMSISTPPPENSPLWKRDDFERFVYTLCAFSLKGVAYRNFKPSQVAASAVAAARYCVGAVTVWTQILYSVSGYRLREIANCIHLLLLDLDCERRQRPSHFLPFFRRPDFAASFLASSGLLLGANIVPKTPTLSVDCRYSAAGTPISDCIASPSPVSYMMAQSTNERVTLPTPPYGASYSTGNRTESMCYGLTPRWLSQTATYSNAFAAQPSSVTHYSAVLPVRPAPNKPVTTARPARTVDVMELAAQLQQKQQQTPARSTNNPNCCYSATQVTYEQKREQLPTRSSAAVQMPRLRQELNSHQQYRAYVTASSNCEIAQIIHLPDGRYVVLLKPREHILDHVRYSMPALQAFDCVGNAPGVASGSCIRGADNGQISSVDSPIGKTLIHIPENNERDATAFSDSGHNLAAKRRLACSMGESLLNNKSISKVSMSGFASEPPAKRARPLK